MDVKNYSINGQLTSLNCKFDENQSTCLSYVTADS